MSKSSSKPGFQGSETTNVEFTVYRRLEEDPFVGFRAQGNLRYQFRGRGARDDEPSIISARTSKSMPAPGRFTVTVKAPEDVDLTTLILDDDWIDLTWFVHDEPNHDMRGIVSNVRESRRAGGAGGATSREFTITGYDFTYIFTRTPIWWNRYAAENAGFADTLKIFQAVNVGGSPAVTTRKIVYGFLETLTKYGRFNWELPVGMPGRVNSESDADALRKQFFFNAEGFNNFPSRYSVSVQLMNPSGMDIWALAQEWSDPMFCEFFADLGDKDGQPIDPSRHLTKEETRMTLFFRDRPFPYVTVPEGPSNGNKSDWLRLPTVDISEFEMTDKDTGPSGALERFNAFFVSPQVLQQLGGRVDVQTPLWDVDNIRLHGFRKFEVQSRYVANKNDLFTMSAAQRRMARDWHAVAAYLKQGTLGLGRLRPDARVGFRARVKNEDEALQETYYIENVDHTWALERGGRTSLGVTRGYVGSDGEFLDKLYAISKRYQELFGKDKADRPLLGDPSATRTE